MQATVGTFLKSPFEIRTYDILLPVDFGSLFAAGFSPSGAGLWQRKPDILYLPALFTMRG